MNYCFENVQCGKKSQKHISMKRDRDYRWSNMQKVMKQTMNTWPRWSERHCKASRRLNTVFRCCSTSAFHLHNFSQIKTRSTILLGLTDLRAIASMREITDSTGPFERWASGNKGVFTLNFFSLFKVMVKFTWIVSIPRLVLFRDEIDKAGVDKQHKNGNYVDVDNYTHRAYIITGVDNIVETQIVSEQNNRFVWERFGKRRNRPPEGATNRNAVFLKASNQNTAFLKMQHSDWWRLVQSELC